MRWACVAACFALAGASGLSAQGLDRSLRAFVRSLVEREVDPRVRYTSAIIDLNGDHRPEAVVQIMGPRFCGSGGCDLYVLERRAGTWRVVTDMSITNAPIRVLNTRTRGWRDLGVIVAGGGIIPGYEARLRFNGRTYPENPSVPPAVELRRRVPGRVLISDDAESRRLF